jgi:hypothetical protein
VRGPLRAREIWGAILWTPTFTPLPEQAQPLPTGWGSLLVDTYFHASRFTCTTWPNRHGFLLHEGKTERAIQSKWIYHSSATFWSSTLTTFIDFEGKNGKSNSEFGPVRWTTFINFVKGKTERAIQSWVQYVDYLL